MHTQNAIDQSELSRILASEGCKLSKDVEAGLAVYLAMLCKWNKRINLNGYKTWQKLAQYLLPDSFHLATFLKTLALPQETLFCDLGAGAGLPGIPLRLLWTQGKYVLVEIREKRAVFLQTLLANLPLVQTEVWHGSATTFLAQRSIHPLCVLSRAFLPWKEFLALVYPYLQTNEPALIFASQNQPDQIVAGWDLDLIFDYVVAGKQRWFWVFKKSGTVSSVHKNDA